MPSFWSLQKFGKFPFVVPILFLKMDLKLLFPPKGGVLEQ